MGENTCKELFLMVVQQVAAALFEATDSVSSLHVAAITVRKQLLPHYRASH